MSLETTFEQTLSDCPEAESLPWSVADADRLFPLLPNGSRHFDDLVMANWWQTDAQGHNHIRLDWLLHPTGVTHTLRFAPGTLTFTHTHDCVELSYVVRGRLVQRISGRDQQFLPGEVCLIDPQSPHSEYLYAEDAQIVFLNIAASFLDQALEADAQDYQAQRFVKEIIFARKQAYQFVRFTPKGPDGAFPQLLEAILVELRDRRPGFGPLVRGYVERLLYLLPVEYQVSLSQAEQREMRTRLLGDLRSYLQEHLQDVTLSDLCATFHYQEDYFNRLLRRQTGLTYKQFLQQLRLQKAHALLQTTDQPVACIAQQVGYANLSYFYRLYQAYYHQTPKATRLPTPK